MDIGQLFEFKPDPWEFLNSPLFLIIVVLIIISIIMAKKLFPKLKNIKKIKRKKEKEINYSYDEEDRKELIRSIIEDSRKEALGNTSSEKTTTSLDKEEIKEIIIETISLIKPELLIEERKPLSKKIEYIPYTVEQKLEKIETQIDKLISNEALKKNEGIMMNEQQEQQTLSQRQTIFEMCERGLSEKDIYNATNFDKNYIKRTVNEWKKRKQKELQELTKKPINIEEENQSSQFSQQISQLDNSLIHKIIDIINKGETVVIENGKLYYPGRDRLTYVFMGISLIELIAIIFLL